MPKIVDHKQRRNQICDAVLTLIAEGGTRAVTTRSAAERAGWSTGAVKHYFDTRDALMLGAFRRAAYLQGKELKRLLQDATLSPMTKLHASVEATLPLDERRVALTRIFLDYYAETNAMEETHDEVVQYLRNWRTWITEIIDECKTDNSLVSARPSATLATELVALTDGLSMHALLDPEVLTSLVEGDTLKISFIDDSWGPIRLARR